MELQRYKQRVTKSPQYMTKRHYLGKTSSTGRQEIVFLDSWDKYELNESEKEINEHMNLLDKIERVALNYTKLNAQGQVYYPWRERWQSHPWQWYAKSQEPSNTPYMRSLRYKSNKYTHLLYPAGWVRTHAAAIIAKCKIRSVWLPAMRRARRRHQNQERTYLAGLDGVLARKNPDITVFSQLPMFVRRYISEYL